METSRVATLEPYPISTLVAHLVSVRFLSVARVVCCTVCFRAEWEASAHVPHETNECCPQGWGEAPGATFSGGPTTAPSVCGTVCSSFQQAAWLRDGVLLLRAQAPQVTASYGAEYE